MRRRRTQPSVRSRAMTWALNSAAPIAPYVAMETRK